MSRSYSEFIKLCEEVYDKDVVGRSQIRKSGEDGRIGANRKLPVTRRMKAVGGGKQEPVSYKPRKDIGQQRSSETRQQQPEKERGSAAASQAAAAKEERRKAALARIAARKSGTQTKEPEKKETAKDVSKQATKLLSTKKPTQEPHPDYKPQKASGMTRAERDKVRNQAKKELYNKKKAELFAQYKEVHGSNPTGKEKTRLLGLAHKAVNS